MVSLLASRSPPTLPPLPGAAAGVQAGWLCWYQIHLNCPDLFPKPPGQCLRSPVANAGPCQAQQEVRQTLREQPRSTEVACTEAAAPAWMTNSAGSQHRSPITPSPGGGLRESQPEARRKQARTGDPHSSLANPHALPGIMGSCRSCPCLSRHSATVPQLHVCCGNQEGPVSVSLFCSPDLP